MKIDQETINHIEQMREERTIQLVMKLSDIVLNMYVALQNPTKTISPKKANKLYGKSRMLLWQANGKLQTTSTAQGRLRYNQHQLEALLKAEKELSL